MFRILITLLFFLSIHPAFAQKVGILSGNDYLLVCRGLVERDPESNMRNAYLCSGYTQGVIHSDIAISHITGSTIACIPKNITPNQAVKVAYKYMNNNPDKTHYIAADLILVSFRNAFPCKK